MAADECFLRESAEDFLRHHRIGFVSNLFHDLMCWSSIEDVVLHGDVLIVKLIQQPKRWDLMLGRPKSHFTQFSGNVLPLSALQGQTEVGHIRSMSEYHVPLRPAALPAGLHESRRPPRRR